MAELSAGVLVWRRSVDAGAIDVLLGHMGGPFWARKDEAAWSIPKGLVGSDEEPIDAAQREFTEELGLVLPPGPLRALGEFRQSAKKTVAVWSVEAGFDALDVDEIVSNTFELEWPPRSGRIKEFPEIDRAAWFDPDTARIKLVAGQVQMLDALISVLD